MVALFRSYLFSCVMFNRGCDGKIVMIAPGGGWRFGQKAAIAITQRSCDWLESKYAGIDCTYLLNFTVDCRWDKWHKLERQSSPSYWL